MKRKTIGIILFVVVVITFSSDNGQQPIFVHDSQNPFMICNYTIFADMPNADSSVSIKSFVSSLKLNYQIP